MKTISSALQTLLDSGQYYMADLYTFGLIGGGAAYLTNADVPITHGDLVYVNAPLTDRSKLSQKTGLDVSSSTITMYPTPTDMLYSEPWLQAMRYGALDGAAVQIERAFMPTMGNVAAGTIILMNGRVGDVKISRTKAEITVNSWTEILKNPFPRNYYQSACGHTLYDVGCGVNPANYTLEGAVTGDNTALGFYVNINPPAGWLSLGRLQMTSGATNGESRTISFAAISGGYFYIQLQQPLTYAPAVGDTFTALAGCDKLLGTCTNKFNNLRKFRGFPFIPDPTTAV